ncbi:hypothetical protein [Hymenobacter sedentarius]|uniref:hypothetical protein n=1 Tax=Hymenobacter sedentarius TaxID=1411621 RepID=UPI000AB1EB57|nr:hypothetical protein [Hymenobacter sedentarius]
MPRILSTLNWNAAACRVGLAGVAVAVAMGCASCSTTTEPAPETGVDYYPVAVGNFWIYSVVDTTWSTASGQGSQLVASVPTRTVYQFREKVTETFTDAAGKTAYRLVRSKLGPVGTTFQDDSVFVLSATPQSVVLNRNNARTLELIFPVREGRLWNLNGYNNNSNDTITAETRRYSLVGKPFTTAATAGTPAKTYAATLTTTNTGTAAENSLVKRTGYQQVFAKGVGPVFRHRFSFLPYTYVGSGGNQVYPAGSYSVGFSRTETLIDYGPR